MSRGWGRERGRHRIQSRSSLGAVSTEPDAGLVPTSCEIKTWAKVEHLTDWATQAPLSLFIFLMFIYFWERERERERERAWGGRGRERGRHRIWNRLQALSCQHRAPSRAQTHKPWDHDLNRRWMLSWLSHPGTPSLFNKWNQQIIEQEENKGKQVPREFNRGDVMGSP